MRKLLKKREPKPHRPIGRLALFGIILIAVMLGSSMGDRLTLILDKDRRAVYMEQRGWSSDIMPETSSQPEI